MLRKSEQNIVPDWTRQVDAIIVYRHGFFTLQRQVTGPCRELKLILKRPEATHALALESQVKLALKEHTTVKFFDLDGVIQRVMKVNDLIPGVELQFSYRQLTLQADSGDLQMTKVNQ
jgi:hypothetical protein